MAYPYDDDDPPICRLCGKDMPPHTVIRICAECVRKESQERIRIARPIYGRPKPRDHK